MALTYHYVLPGTGPLDAAAVREMFDDVKAYVDTLAPGGTVVTSLNAGTGINLSATTGDITITNSGVTAISTTNVNSSFSTSTGAVVFSFSAAPTFQSVDLSVGTGAMIITPALGVFSSWHMRFPPDPGTSGYLLSTDGNDPANTSWIAPTTVKAITGTTNQISVDNSGDPIVLSTPQDIATSSAPTFNQLLLSGGTSSADLTIKLHDSHNGFYADGVTVLDVVLNSTIAAQWDFTTFQFWNTGPIQAGSFKFRDAAGSHPTVTINPPTSFTSYTLTLPVDDGTSNQYLTTNGSGVLSWTNAAGTGTVNSGTQYQLAYYAANGTAVSGLTLITAGHVLVSDSNGLPVAATPTTTEINYVAGVTSALQTQIDSKANLVLSNLAAVAINTSLLPGSDNAIDLGSSSKDFRSLYLKTSLVIQQTGVGTNAITIQGPAAITSHTLTLPGTQGASSTILQNNGSGVLSWVSVTAAGGATIALDNLSTVAINTSLLPASDNAIDLGSSAKDWRSIYVSTSLKNGSTTLATVTELGYLTGVTSAIQTQLNAKATDSLVVHLAGSEAITGAKTFDSSTILLKETGGGSDTITLATPSLAASYTLTLPTTDGNANQVLQTDGSGILSWATVASSIVYKRPILTFINVTTVDVENNTATANQTSIAFPDNTVIAVTENTGSANKYRRFDITATANFTSGTEDSGLRSGLSEATNTWYAIYAVKSQIDATKFVLVGDTNLPSNWSSNDSNFGANSWVFLGMIRNGDNSGATGDILKFIQHGNRTNFLNKVTTGGSSMSGFRLANTAGATSVAWTYASGTGTAQVPINVLIGDIYYAANSTGTSLDITYQSDTAQRIFREGNTPGTACVTLACLPLTNGITAATTSSTAQDIGLAGFIDSALGVQ